MTENDLKLFADVLREARALAEDVAYEHVHCFIEDCECPFCGGPHEPGKLLDALDRFKFKASFTVPE